jgi:hypothetical protein
MDEQTIFKTKIHSIMAWPTAQEHFIAFNTCESFKSYIVTITDSFQIKIINVYISQCNVLPAA